MNKTTLSIALAVLLVVSLAGNGVLLVQARQQAVAIDSLSRTLTGTRNQLSMVNTDLVTTRFQLAMANDQLKTLTRQVTNENILNANLTGERDPLLDMTSFPMCATTIAASSLAGLSSNQGLVGPITKAVEGEYSFIPVDATYSPLWNNSKTAIFTFLDDKNETVKAVASWDPALGRIDAIFDLASGCLTYVH